MSSQRLSRGWRFVLTGFILFHVSVILLGALARDHQITKGVYPYLVWTRLLQRWDLFVPAPRPFAMKYYARIRYRDGQTVEWRRPYPPKWDFFERHLAYHYQRWDLATARLEKNQSLWRDLVRFLEARYQKPENPIIMIEFVKQVAARPAPNTEGYVFSGDEVLQWQDTSVFRFDVETQRFVP